jgi:hypothetical protein
VKYEVQKYPPVGWSFAAKVLMLRCYCLLEGCGLLLACPSPPGSTPACPSPPSKLLVPALILLVRGYSTMPPSSASRDSIPWFVCWMVVGAVRTCVLLCAGAVLVE